MVCNELIVGCVLKDYQTVILHTMGAEALDLLCQGHAGIVHTKFASLVLCLVARQW